jgi:hypothetical protein
MAVAAPGVYLAFDGGPDGSSSDDPGIGPYEEIVLRGARAVGERAGLGRIIALRSSAGRWRDAETESSSADSDQIGTGRGGLRVSADSGEVIVRFSDDEVAGSASVPDLGPFAVVVVGTYELRGDDETLAVRVSRISPWQLTERAGSSFQGALKDALSFVANGRSAASPARPTATTSAPRPRPESPERVVPDGVEAPTNGTDSDAPSVWVDRAKAAPDIYISRPDRKR